MTELLVPVIILVVGLAFIRYYKNKKKVENKQEMEDWEHYSYHREVRDEKKVS